MTLEPFPSGWLNLPSWPRTIGTDNLLRAITAVVSMDDIEAVAIFGSSVRPLRRRLFGLYKVWAKDIDVIVMSKQTSARAKADETYVVRCGDWYGAAWYEDRCRRDVFDVLVVTPTEFAGAFQRDEDIARSVLWDGVLLAGEWPPIPGADPYRDTIPHKMRRFIRVGWGATFEIDALDGRAEYEARERRLADQADELERAARHVAKETG